MVLRLSHGFLAFILFVLDGFACPCLCDIILVLEDILSLTYTSYNNQLDKIEKRAKKKGYKLNKICIH